MATRAADSIIGVTDAVSDAMATTMAGAVDKTMQAVANMVSLQLLLQCWGCASNTCLA